MTALGKEIVFIAAMSHGLPDQLFASPIAFCRVDDVQAIIEGLLEQSAHMLNRRLADLVTSEAQHAYLHIGIAEEAPLHFSFMPLWLHSDSSETLPANA
jgi:hypothetical protein